jgi:hypothetical protein
MRIRHCGLTQGNIRSDAPDGDARTRYDGPVINDDIQDAPPAHVDQ